jgi:hypothetical protein
MLAAPGAAGTNFGGSALDGGDDAARVRYLLRMTDACRGLRMVPVDGHAYVSSVPRQRRYHPSCCLPRSIVIADASRLGAGSGVFATIGR